MESNDAVAKLALDEARDLAGILADLPVGVLVTKYSVEKWDALKQEVVSFELVLGKDRKARVSIERPMCANQKANQIL